MTLQADYHGSPLEVLLVEDNPGDVRLTLEVFKESNLATQIVVVKDGVEALAYLYQEGVYQDAKRPDLILLDLNLPRKDGREVLAEVKRNPHLRRIPIIVLTSSDSGQDIQQAYDLHANCYIAKPVDFTQFIQVVRLLKEFWFTVAQLPSPD